MMQNYTKQDIMNIKNHAIIEVPDEEESRMIPQNYNNIQKKDTIVTAYMGEENNRLDI